ncbi:hypothetical protein [Moorena sp. SIO3A2]|uniref:hypothetical protein n=1 Tax=Moorena sp. SIO3A2 TaxID=2607841 RepID=UPI0013BC8EFA|nr:hypothetical protein [Moorena sp. SIO3A2]NER89934.1 hypothetical protein [Moorena sp. SIO3A2]
MSPVKREEISLYEEAKAGLSSLFWQIAQVFTSLLIIFLFVGGSPPGWLVITCFIVGSVFVFWRENKRTKDELDEHEQDELGEYEPIQRIEQTINNDLELKQLWKLRRRVILKKQSWWNDYKSFISSYKQRKSSDVKSGCNPPSK